MPKMNVYLNFTGQCEEAFAFYKDAFGTEYSQPIVRFGDLPETEDVPPMPEEQKRQVMNIALALPGGATLHGSDILGSMGGEFLIGDNMHIVYETDTRAEADRLYAALSEGGEITMPISEMFWGQYWSSFKDRFGTQWMIVSDAKE